jgi:hypothetical protein
MTIVDLGRLQVKDYVDESDVDVGLVEVGQPDSSAWKPSPDANLRPRSRPFARWPKLIDDIVYYTVHRRPQNHRVLLKLEMIANVSLVVAPISSPVGSS